MGPTRTYDIGCEPTGDTYVRLLEAGLEFCPMCLLVVRPHEELSRAGLELLAALRPYELSIKTTDSWPGTKLIGADNTAHVHCIALNQSTLDLLERATDRLYAWQHPELPEDLCLLRADASPWLTTIAHEHDAYLTLCRTEATYVAQHVPDLSLRHSSADGR